MIGESLGAFEIRGPLGSGGMGEVYLAWDTKLEREVAIKLLPEEFANDADRLGRFEREAKLLASLSHPNISGIYGIEEADGKRFLSLEFVPGEPLAARIKARRLRIREVLEITRQIADALEAAHRDGIIHRDLKPSNVMITPDGTAKVLDFGLGKAFSSAATSDADAEAPTESSGLTSSGLVVGTVPYMSPEQARGFAVDKRTDIWSFGCVLYEALSGRRAFEGETHSDTIVAVLEHEPGWEALPAKTPARIMDLLRRCLNKDPSRRLRHIGDAKLEIEEAAAELSGDSLDAFSAIKQRRHIDWRRAAPWLVAGLAVVVAVVAITWGNLDREQPWGGKGPSFRETLLPDERLFINEFGHPFAISADGRYLAYSAHRGTSDSALYVRDLNELESRQVPGTGGARSPFFSPDGQWIGYFADGKLQKVSMDGGTPTTLCDTMSFFGATWLDDDTIVFTDATRLLRIPAEGGSPMLVVSSDVERAEYFDSPAGLPGSRAVLITTITADEGHVEAVILDTGARKLLLDADYPRIGYANSGHLVYGESGTIFAAPFDAEELQVTGPSAAVREDVDAYGDGTGAIFAFSDGGTLVYVPTRQTSTVRSLVWADREGNSEPVTDELRSYSAPRISPDGRQVAVTIIEHSRSYNVWIYDLDEHKFRRLTFEGNNEVPIWAPDGSRLAFLSYRDGLANLYSKAADGGGSAELLLDTETDAERAAGAGHFRYPSAWSPDGRFIAYYEATPGSQWDVSMLSLDGRRSTPAMNSAAGELSLRFSRDGEWIAYVSNETGQYEVYVEHFPSTGGKWQISRGGGVSPIWAPDGQELYFDNGRGQIMAASIQTEPTFSPGAPESLIDLTEIWTTNQINATRPGNSTRPVAEFDLAPDGGRFLVVSAAIQELAPWEFVYVLNWSRDLERMAPVRD